MIYVASTNYTGIRFSTVDADDLAPGEFIVPAEQVDPDIRRMAELFVTAGTDYR